MASTLRSVITYGSSVEDAVQAALNTYNAIDARKIYHRSDIREDLLILKEDRTYTARVIIWFTANTDDPIEPELPTFIGSRGIDPNDPDWREKLNQLQNTSVTSQEGSGATED